MMKDFETWANDKKHIGECIAVPLYRTFCKENQLNFHFADKKYKGITSEQYTSLLLKEMPIHSSALTLFNSKNKQYHPIDNQIVSFMYSSWDDFDYQRYTLPEISNMLSEKDERIKLLRLQASIYSYLALTSCLVATTISINQLRSRTLLIAGLLIVIMITALLPHQIEKHLSKRDKWLFQKKIKNIQEQLAQIQAKCCS